MSVTLAIEAELATIPAAIGITPRTAVALPSSDIDPAEGEMRLRAGGIEIIRAYDPDLEQP